MPASVKPPGCNSVARYLNPVFAGLGPAGTVGDARPAGRDDVCGVLRNQRVGVWADGCFAVGMFPAGSKGPIMSTLSHTWYEQPATDRPTIRRRHVSVRRVVLVGAAILTLTLGAGAISDGADAASPDQAVGLERPCDHQSGYRLGCRLQVGHADGWFRAAADTEEAEPVVVRREEVPVPAHIRSLVR